MIIENYFEVFCDNLKKDVIDVVFVCVVDFFEFVDID